MAEPYFQFRRFRVYHHQDVLKVGTDGVLLGAWAEVKYGESVLDIGTGTGLIAMMLAQRARVRMDAIDISEKAAQQATCNFERAYLTDMRAFCCDLSTWCLDQEAVYDLIVCNPPFFTHAQPPKSDALHLAKHTVGLTPAILFREVARLLRPSGRFSTVFPVQGQEEFYLEAAANGLHVSRRTMVHPLRERPAKRVLVTFVPRPTEPFPEDELVLENEAGIRGYSEAYKRLTEQFYLRF